jgi:hypothetical protein
VVLRVFTHWIIVGLVIQPTLFDALPHGEERTLLPLEVVSQ